MPDPDQNYLDIMCIENCNEKDQYSLIKQSLIFQGCNFESYKANLIAPLTPRVHNI